MTSAVHAEVVYPDSDGEPMADNDLQRELMNQLKYGLERQFSGEDVYVTANVFWYPVQGDPATCTAPDVMVVFGRPPGLRRSYLQWQEAGKAPDVVVEILSPSNTVRGMLDKLAFYDRFGVAEYQVFDPATGTLDVWLRLDAALVHRRPTLPWHSPGLDVALEVLPALLEFTLAVTGRDGRRFPSMPDLASERDDLAVERDDLASERDDLASERDDLAAERDDLAAERDDLQRRLREAGIDP